MRVLLFLVLSLIFIEQSNAQTTFVVTSAGDESDFDIEDGIFDPPTLRAAIENSNHSLGTDIIKFSGITSINLSSNLPAFSEPIHLIGKTDVDERIIINGGGIANDFAPGIIIGIDADDTIISNISIVGFDLGGIAIYGSRVELDSLYIGTTDGLVASPNGDQFAAGTTPALLIKGDNVSITNSVISGNYGTGIYVDPNNENASTTIYNNIIGLDKDGNVQLGNLLDGIRSESGILDISENVISDNSGNGIVLNGSNAESDTFTKVSYNNIGVNASGNEARGNELIGLIINDNHVVIEQNIISHNLVGIQSNGADHHIKKNYIGVDVTGKVDIGNENQGLIIYGNENLIGGDDVEDRNIISGNGGEGVVIYGEYNTLISNYIGVTANGDSILANDREGLLVELGAQANDIISNLISGNARDGIELKGQNDDSSINANYIGTNSSGTKALPNQENGILLIDASGIQIGSGDIEDRNVVSGNRLFGIQAFITSSKPDTLNELTIDNNIIGLDATGGSLIGNNQAGIQLANWNSVVKSNIISGNTIGLDIHGKKNTIVSNLIGTDVEGLNSLGNLSNGVVIRADSNKIGDPFDQFSGNLISGSQYSGILIFGSSNFNSIGHNYIGVNRLGTEPFANGRDGISFGVGSSYNVIYGNLISGNFEYGLKFIGRNKHNGIYANYIGTDAQGRIAIPNEKSGVYFKNGEDNDIGEGVANNGNLISGNNGYGIEMDDHISDDAEKGIRIRNNSIGTNVDGKEILSNKKGGILLLNQRNALIGGEIASQESNIIAGNDTVGIYIRDTGFITGEKRDSIIVIGNFIGLNSDLDAVPNKGDALFIDALYNDGKVFIGKDSLDHKNIIAYNEGVGIAVIGERIVSMEFNQIYNNEYLAIDLGYNGVTINDLNDEDIGENFLLNYPSITNAIYNKIDEKLTVFTDFNSEPGYTYFLDFYYNEKCDDSGYGEAEYYLDSIQVITDESGNNTDSIQVNLPLSRVDHLDGIYVTSNTWTDTIGNSEMSECFYVAFKGSGGNQPDLSLTKTDSLDQVFGSDVPAIWEYSITVKNIGSQTASNVQVIDTLATDLTTVNYWVSKGDIVQNENIITANIDSLESQDSVVIYIEVESGLSGEVINTAHVTMAEDDPSPLNNFDTDTTEVLIEVTEEMELDIPSEFELQQNYPNPFNPSTTINYSVPEASFVEIIIYNSVGVEVAAIVDEQKSPGIYNAIWDATNFASGFYIYRMKTGTFTSTKKMLLIK